MGVPIGEFRSFDITGAEPADRTTEGVVVSASSLLDLGTVNNTSGSELIGPFCLIYRISDMAGNSSVYDIAFALIGNSALDGTNEYYLDITNTWTQNKTSEQVAAGNPGICPQSFPSSPNLQKKGGGDIAGTDHANTSQYIYIAFKIGQNESVGTDKGGACGGIRCGTKSAYQ